MRSSADLLAIAAALLARSDPNASEICRAVSTTYYAIFDHLLIEAGRAFLGFEEDGLSRARDHLMRSVRHEDLSKRCKNAQAEAIGFPREVIEFANAVRSAYWKRVGADYGCSDLPTRGDALELLDRVRTAISAFDQLESKHRRAFFVWALFRPGQERSAAQG